MELTERDPARIWLDRGVGSHDRRWFRWIVEGEGAVNVSYVSQKGGTIERTLELEAGEARNP
jgi:hypothetical protein